jgi:hypothetical protein
VYKKYSDLGGKLSDKLVEKINECCKTHDEEFREFIEEFIMDDNTPVDITGEEMAYEFYKPYLRDKKINEVLK